MPYTPIPNFNAGQIPNVNDEANFHADATYVFNTLGSNIIPSFNTNLLWMETALTGSATLIDSVADIISGVQPLASSNVTGDSLVEGESSVQGDLKVGKDGGGDSRARFYDDNSDTWRNLFWDNSADDWRVQGSSGTVRALWHAGNDGAGSGLDADKLDGLQSTDFVRYISGGTASNILASRAWVVANSSSSNFDHIWNDETTNTWHFVNDAAFKSDGNAKIKASHFLGNGASVTDVDATKLGGKSLSDIARTDIAETFTDNVIVQGDLHVGKNGSGNSHMQFYDDNSNTWRALYWSDSGNEFRMEDGTGSLDAVTSKNNVGEHIASKSVGSVGTYAWLGKPTDGKITQGNTYSGSSLRYAGTLSGSTYSDDTAMDITGTTPSGTWRAMGRTDQTTGRNSATLFLRIS